MDGFGGPDLLAGFGSALLPGSLPDEDALHVRFKWAFIAFTAANVAVATSIIASTEVIIAMMTAVSLPLCYPIW